MRWPLPILLALLIMGLALPVVAADWNRIGYASFEQVRMELTNEKARLEVDYTLDPGMSLVIILFGSGDLQRKLEKALNFPSMEAEEVGLSHAVFSVDDAAESYGDGAYWFRPHIFGITFPEVKVEAPGYSLDFAMASAIPAGFGYFGDMP
jgi:hypothetical protein